MANRNDKSEKNIKKYIPRYKDEYSKQYSCIVKSSKSDEHAFCTICSADISISRILPFQVGISVVRMKVETRAATLLSFMMSQQQCCASLVINKYIRLNEMMALLVRHQTETL